MKRILYYILNVVLAIFMIFGILGIIVMATQENMDIGGMVFYIIWAALGFSLLFLLSRYKKSFFQRKKTYYEPAPEINSHSEVNSSPLYKKESVPDCNVPVKPVLVPEDKEDSMDLSFSLSYESPDDQKAKEIESEGSDVAVTDNIPEFPEIYLSFDVETPNRKNDRISQIGLLLIQNGNIVENHSTLINPETYFEGINTEITGLDASKVSHAPTLIKYWPSVKDLFENYVVIAHNAAFDLTVLYKALVSYGIEFPKIKYVCTYNEAMNKFPELKKFSLNALAEHFNISLENHHNAGADAKVCSLIFEEMKSQNFTFIPEEFKASVKSSQIAEDSKIEEPKAETVQLPYVMPEESSLTGIRCVLTGIFTMISKSELTEYIESQGGKVTGSVSGVTNYLIVGTNPEPAWKHGGYGSKIEKAMKLISEGNKKLHFVKEEDFITKFIPDHNH